MNKSVGTPGWSWGNDPCGTPCCFQSWSYFGTDCIKHLETINLMMLPDVKPWQPEEDLQALLQARWVWVRAQLKPSQPLLWQLKGAGRDTWQEGPW